MSRHRDLFAVHIGNLHSKATEEDLRIVFSGCGDVREIYIAPQSSSPVTYAFVRYVTLAEAGKACKDCHGVVLHGSAIAVTFAESTTKRMSGGSPSFKNYDNKSISKNSFPNQRREGGSKESEVEIHNKLKKSLAQLKNKDNELTNWMQIKTEEDTLEFMRDFKEVLVSMAKTPQSIAVDAVMFEKTQKIGDLENLIIDFHSCSVSKEQYLPFKAVDYDLYGSGTKTS